jgi:hypothetical protein
LITGGRNQLNGSDHPDYMGNARFGVSFGWSLTRRQAIKISYFEGAFTRVGNDIRSFGITYNIVWLKGR